MCCWVNTGVFSNCYRLGIIIPLGWIILETLFFPVHLTVCRQLWPWLLDLNKKDIDFIGMHTELIRLILITIDLNCAEGIVLQNFVILLAYC